MISDLEKYTGRRIDMSTSGIATFGMNLRGGEFASPSDMEWIRRVESDDSQTDITSLWTHLVNGDDWHRSRFAKAYQANTDQETWGSAFGRGAQVGTQAFFEGASFGAIPAQEWARNEPGFQISRGIGMITTTIEVGLATGGAAAGFTAPVAASTVATTVTAVQAGGLAQSLAGVTVVAAEFSHQNLNNPESPDTSAFAGNAAFAAVMGAPGGGRKRFAPDPTAQGPHSVFRRDPISGRVTHYATYQPQSNPMNPAPWEMTKRVDVVGKPHFNKETQTYVPTPHVQGPNIPGGARPAEPDELPR
jgi:hypothetical protein